MDNQKSLIPFNIELLILNSDMIRKLGEVKTKDIFQQNSTTFHPEGLFSTEIFGEVGTIDRMERFGYINLYLPVLHPLIYRHVTKLKSLYSGILNGTKYVVFDKKLKDFVEVPITEGFTGFDYFMEYYDQIEFQRTDSKQRDELIRFIKKYKSNQVLTDKWLVIPAGLREYIITSTGKELKSEINDIYIKLLSIASTAKNFKDTVKNGGYNAYINSVRMRLQKVVLEIYEYIENILDGKEGFIQGKWTKRRLIYGTRNVITALPIKVEDNRDKDRPGFNHTVIGLYQFMKGIAPVTIFNVRTKFLSRTFDKESHNAYLYNKKTFKKELVQISEKTRSKWVTDDGLEETMNKLIQDDIKSSPIIVDNHYLYLVYDDGERIYLIDNIDNLPEGLDKKYIRPMKYVELFYLSIYDDIKRFPGFVTRYPITGMGSVYPSYFYVKTTLKGRTVKFKGFTDIEERVIKEYPDFTSKYFNSMSPNVTHLARLGADSSRGPSYSNVRRKLPELQGA